MIKKLLIAWHCIFLLTPILVFAEQPVTVLKTPVQVVSAFQKFDSHDMGCSNVARDDVDPIKTGKKFEAYLSREFYKLFLWTQCYEPNYLTHYQDIEFLWDFRSGMTGGGTLDDFRVGRATYYSHLNVDTAEVVVSFDIGPEKYMKNIKTTYTLILEDGKWKIDDIAPKGDEGAGDYYGQGGEPLLKSSGSIKTDMQTNYNKAIARYQKEQAAKGATPKP